MRICLIVGTRPQIIKSYPIIKELSGKLDLTVIHTGQHYDYKLSQTFFEELKIRDPDLNLCVNVGSPVNQLSEIIDKLEKPLKKIKPHIVLVPGDTTSALAAALTASKSNLNVAHLEAGVRDYQFYMQEEINRRLIDHCSHILFAPTKSSFLNLKKESVFGKKYFVGDTMYDLFLEQYKKYRLDLLKKQQIEKQILVTIHRRENVDNKTNLKKICLMINKLASKHEIMFPLHPHTRKKLKEFKLKINANLIEPTGYLDTLRLIAKSKLVITDSGGLQKEVYWMGRPCVTLLEKIGWIETEQEKANFAFPLSKPINTKKIEKISLLEIKPKKGLFGNGNATKKISSIICRQILKT